MLARLGVDVTLFFRDRAPLRGFDETLRSAAAAVAVPVYVASLGP